MLDLPKNSRCKVLKHVPKAARTSFAQALTTLIKDVIRNPTNINSWLRELLFAHHCLKAPARSNSRKKQSLASLVNKQMAAFLEFDINDLMTQVMSEEQKFSTRKNTSTTSNIAKFISEKLDMGDVKGAVSIASSADFFATPDETNLKLLQDKHPDCPERRRPFPSIDNEADTLTVTSDLVKDMINSSPNGSGAGTSSLRAQLSKDGISVNIGETGKKLLDSITELCNILFSNEIPVSVQPLLFGTNLISLEKTSGGLRPIAVGKMFRRLAGKFAAGVFTIKLAPMMALMELGAGVRFGAEAAAHAARSFINNMLNDMVFLKIGSANAFNTVRRDCLAEAFELHAPEVYPFVECCYEQSSFFCYGDYDILSTEGFQ